MKEFVFILSSLNDTHYIKRVEEFIDNGYKVTVYGYKRKGKTLPKHSYVPIILGEIQERNYSARLNLFRTTIKSIASSCKGKIVFYSSLDVAIFGRMYIDSPYIYEVCDLTELTIGNSVIRNLLSYINRRVIKKSIKTIITSEGFAEYFGEKLKDKFYLIPNKISPNIPHFVEKSRKLDKIIKIGFVGIIRFETIFRFINSCADYGKNIEIHLYGIYSEADEWAIKTKMLKADNIFYHGPFSNPNDLPMIYENIDLLLCAYTPSLGVMYAEPNKLYEAIYFRCPIIVSENVFIGDKVKRLGVGYAINSMNKNSVIQFLESLNNIDYQRKIEACKAISQENCLNNNHSFFDYIRAL
jgi:glycosyltransferase involved in cell wall biosynthesis